MKDNPSRCGAARAPRFPGLPRALGVLAAAASLLCPMLACGEGIEDLQAGVVKVVSIRPDGGQRVGTGILVSLKEGRAYIVTAAHVVKGSTSSVEFFTERNRRFEARVVAAEAASGAAPAEDAGDDLAALVVEGKLPSGIRELSFEAAAQVAAGDPAQVIGFPRQQLEGTAWAVTTGSITGVKDRRLTFQAPVLEGNSGGPLIRKGRVIGVVAVKIHEQFGQAVPTEIVQLALKPVGIHVKVIPSGDLSGTWRNQVNETLSYVFAQQGATVSVQEISREPGRPAIRTAQGIGQVEGRMLTLNLVTRFGTAGVSRLTLSDDGTLLSGTFTDPVTGLASLVSLSRSAR